MSRTSYLFYLLSTTIKKFVGKNIRSLVLTLVLHVKGYGSVHGKRGLMCLDMNGSEDIDVIVINVFPKLSRIILLSLDTHKQNKNKVEILFSPRPL